MTDESVFEAARAIPDPKQRAAFLDRACPDPAARREVEALLAAHAASNPLDRRPVDLAVTGMYEPPVEQPGARVGPYKLLQQIGEGGMGTVFMAEQEEPVRRRVALKIVKPGMDSKQVVARFEAERQALSMMDHPNIARVLDAGTTASGRPYFVMELVHGVPITDFCDANKLTPRERLGLFVPVCQAIQHAHMKGVIHRDVKPSNVLVTMYDDKPVPKVIDFGVAKAVEQRLTEKTLFTQFGTLVGTFEYMSPEQAEMNALGVDTRSDVYSLGVLLYELLTGTTPLERQRLRSAALGEVVRLIREEEPPRPSHRLSTSGTLDKVAAARKTEPGKLPALVRGELDWIVMRCLEKDRTRRYETASGLARDVQRYLSGDAVEACPPTLGYRLRKAYRRNRGTVAVGALILAALILGAGATLWQATERQRDRAVVDARTRESVLAALDQAAAALRADRPTDASAALTTADRGLVGMTAPDLEHRLAALQKDVAMVNRLNGVLERVWSVSISRGKGIDTERGAALYRAAFEEYDFAIGTGPSGSLAEAVRASPISANLLAAMWDWFFLAPNHPRLREVIDAADPEPFRVTVRDAVTAGNADRVRELAAGVDAAGLPPGFAVALGSYVMSTDTTAGLRVLKAAWLAHPEYYPLARQIGFLVFSGAVNDTEAIQWFRLALGIRPDAEAYANLAFALFTIQHGDKRRPPECEMAIRRAIDLGLNDALYHTLLGLILLEKPDIGGAEAAFQRALLLHPSDYSARVGLIRVYWKRKDWDAVMRTLEECDRTTDDGSEANFYLMGFNLGTMQAITEDLPATVGATRPWLVVRYYMKRQPKSYDSAADPKRQPDPVHYGAACLAVLLSSGVGADAPPPTEWPAIRHKALEWLSADLAHWKGCVSLDPGANRDAARGAMTHWLGDPDLRAVREDGELAKLPADERRQWVGFWAEVRSLRDRTAPPERAPPPREFKK